jgi:hypothetical protein
MARLASNAAKQEGYVDLSVASLLLEEELDAVSVVMAATAVESPSASSALRASISFSLAL